MKTLVPVNCLGLSDNVFGRSIRCNMPTNEGTRTIRKVHTARLGAKKLASLLTHALRHKHHFRGEWIEHTHKVEIVGVVVEYRLGWQQATMQLDIDTKQGEHSRMTWPTGHARLQPTKNATPRDKGKKAPAEVNHR